VQGKYSLILSEFGALSDKAMQKKARSYLNVSHEMLSLLSLIKSKILSRYFKKLKRGAAL